MKNTEKPAIYSQERNEDKMDIIEVRSAHPYDVLIGRGILDEAGALIEAVSGQGRFAIIADDNTAPLYADRLIASLEKAGLGSDLFVFEHGEKSKSPETLGKIYSFLAKNHYTRTDGIIALGGGVTGDMAGYASATYLRGMHFVQIPTSLLSQVDSSVGSKTAIDIPEGKNLVGAFKSPDIVIMDTDTLSTLPRSFLIDGMGEVVKYGMIKSASLFETLRNHNIDNIMDIIDDVVAQCVRIKRDVVENDEFEKGERRLLNFGHTLGHSIEQYYNYTGISHGRAVAKGMELITELAAQHGLCESSLCDELSSCLKNYELCIDIEPTLPQLAQATLNDKKRSGSNIGIVVCSGVGASHVETMPVDDFMGWLN
ncbi:MAG: 3-dehydroquinate synthase [Oscillospiraceae bacterium]|nr:3-dehydroquinate synthase [Oscillospiraceae bacterium]